jgi:outer membrane protein assembly factor BamB
VAAAMHGLFRPARVFLSLIAFCTVTARARAGEDWPQFRGPTQQGVSDSVGLPAWWSEAEHVTWKTPIPGEGWSSPVVLGEQVWLTTATDLAAGPTASAANDAAVVAAAKSSAANGKSLRAVCVDRNTGKIIHDVEVFAVAKPEPKNSFNSYASPTPVLEDGRVYVSFGTYGNASLDAKTGKPVWKNADLKLDHKEGPGSSPVMYKGLFLLHCDGTDVQYAVALDKNTGKVAWRTDRTTDFGNKPGDIRKAYCVPLIVNANGRDQMVSVAAFRAFSYDPTTGKELWALDTPGYSVVPRPVYGDGLVFVCTGYNTAQLWAVDPTGSGDVGATHVRWKATKGIPLKPSLIYADGRLYFVSDKGIAQCLDAKTGKEVWRHRLDGDFTASPVLADGRIYFFSEQGKTYVLRTGDEFEQVAESELDGRFMASPAVAGRAMFLRTDKALYRVE